MNNCRWLIQVGFALLVLLALAPCGLAQDDGDAATQGIDSGNYNVQQTIDFGYRLNEVGGNYDTYDTFVNLQSGVRLFDYTLDMRSLNHNGLLFDNLHFSNFGYGGDPNDVSRLHIDKNKWYEFDFTFRRDANFWDYNLFANPLNPAAPTPLGSPTTDCIVSGPTTAHPGLPGYCSSPAVAITNSAHALNLVRRMQDYDLMLFPQSRVRVRLGYSHDRDQGPGFLTGDIGGSVPDLPETYSYTTNAYRAGVDFRFLPRTTISYDQFLSYFKQDNSVLLSPTATPGSFNAQATNGTPVYSGLVWSDLTPAEAVPCAATAVNTATTPLTLGPACAGYSYYSQQAGRPRDFTPTERVRFESDYFHNFEMSGSFGYSSSNNQIPNFNELLIGWTSRTSSPGSTSAGPADAKRVSVDGDWSGVYSVTEKLRIEDQFRYYNWRMPGLWNSVLGSLFNTIPGGTGLGAPVGAFVSANCAGAGFAANETTCPNHAASSAADVVNAYNWNFLKQDMKTNTFKLDYEFTQRINAYIGYLYDHRDIVQSSLSYTTADIYYPGGAAGTAGNYYLAARGSCALVAGVLPAGCNVNPDGSITFTPAAPTTGPTYTALAIDENALLAGFTARPVDTLRLNGELTYGYSDAAFTRISPRHVQGYKFNATYTPKPWVSLDGAVAIHDNQDDVATVSNVEHDRSYSFTTTLMPNPKLAVSFGYNYWDVYTQSDICFNYSITYTNPAPPPSTLPVSTSPPGVDTFGCNIPNASVGAAGLEALSTYSSADHFAHADVMWKPAKRVTAVMGYGGSFVRGNSIFLNPLMPSGTLDYNYQLPYASITVQLYKGVSYKTAWNYYGFNEAGVTSPFGIASIPLQDFNGSNATFSVRYAF
ncbi:MAG TPA: hypothetical protein VNK23_14590 [Candidatus Dormibacteraeota bacterium]|nr:hypothetical protein [Candidatus Dormibacteraeota bacterium]